MIEVNGACDQGRYEKKQVEKFVCQTLKFLPRKMAHHPDTTH